MQGRFKRDGSASAEPEPHGGTDRGSSPQHAQNPGPGEAGKSGGRTGAPKAPTPPAKPTSSGPSSGSRVALRNWRISTRLVSLLALPVVAATSLGALRISDSMDEIQQLDNMKLLTDMTKQATELAAALQDERDQSAGPLAHGATATDFTVKGVRQKTDRARSAFLSGTQEIDDASGNGQLSGVRDSVVGLAGELSNLSSIRNVAYKDSENATQTVEGYHRLITQLLGLSQDMAEATSNPEMIQRTRALAAFSTAKEYASVQRAVIAASLPASNNTFGKLSENDRQYALSALDSQESEISSFNSIYGDGYEDLTKPIDSGNPTIEAADEYAKRALSDKNGIRQQNKRSYKDWVDDDSAKLEQMSKIELTLLNQMEQKARELRNQSEQEAIISGALILIVLGVSLVGAFVVARSMIRSLRRLQDTATKVAQDRLPELVRQLSESDPQDVDTSVESVGVHSKDEIGQVAAAFDDVHREAVRLAAEQALLRGNVNAMFTNLSRRSQGLIQRQLSLISELESREADPDQLSSLFKLDHLATRMRRNGENLLVLAGEEPGRRWTRPVPLVDVLRAAASEVEQYERIELSSVPTTEVAGRVVNDLVHLLAELLENATSFSSPQTKVKVTGHALPDGRVLIEIHDTGIGLSPEDLAAINERLAAPPTVDVSVSRRMGLFVVGRLSQRHGIRIQLRPSDSGGTTALVMLPVDVAQGGKKVPGKPGQGAPGIGGPAAAQASAGVAAARRGGQSGSPSLGAGAPRATPAVSVRLRSADRWVPVRARVPHCPAATRADVPARRAEPGVRSRVRRHRSRAGRPPRVPVRVPVPSGRTRRAPRRASRRRRPSTRARRPPVRAASATAVPARAGAAASATAPPRPHPRSSPSSLSSSPRSPVAAGRSCRVAVARGPNCPAAAPSRARPAGATRTRSRRCRAPRSTPPAATRSRTRCPPPPGCRASTTARDPARPRRSPGSTTARDPAPLLSSPVPTSTPRAPARRRRRAATGSSAARTCSAPATRRHPRTGSRLRAAPRTRRPPDSRRPTAAPRTRRPPASSRRRATTVPARVSTRRRATTRPARVSTRRRARATARTPRPRASSSGRRPVAPPTSVSPGRRPRSVPRVRSSPRRCRRRRVPATGVRRCTTRWRPTGSTVSRASRASSRATARRRPPAAAAVTCGPQRPAPTPAASSWRSTPNDDLVKQAERVRQPSAGGVTTSGLPRRVPRANLVAGTAQQQQHQAGPQVSRAPDDVRGRLTNLRRGIQQGRQAGTGQTGSFPSPTHQQER
uniref:histidine kinase n=1 Tax=Streptomyces avermitilis TaxID=33903 RepID=A0A499VLR3_STRAX|nr:hypothetical protein SAVMC3_31300 [Streptomyces avermitilis]